MDIEKEMNQDFCGLGALSPIQATYLLISECVIESLIHSWVYGKPTNSHKDFEELDAHEIESRDTIMHTQFLLCGCIQSNARN